MNPLSRCGLGKVVSLTVDDLWYGEYGRCVSRLANLKVDDLWYGEYGMCVSLDLLI